MKKSRIVIITQSALIGAMYVALTWLSNAVGLASGAVQVRLSEALCILPYFMPSAVPGLLIGCLIANLTMGSVVWDIIFGSLATLVGAIIASKIKNKYLVPLPNVIANTIVVPIVVLLCYTDKSLWNISTYAITAIGVFAGEVVSSYILGLLLLFALDSKKGIFTNKFNK
ncbi:MAG: QueT transporter family protein [Clostridia bacterium]|nr:QueT transporter family protein [Clostridia bacterium]